MQLVSSRCAQGHPQAQYQLGCAYANGVLEPPNPEADPMVDAIAWLTLAAHSPLKDARHALIALRATPEQWFLGEKAANAFVPLIERRTLYNPQSAALATLPPPVQLELAFPSA
jgi:TPR repeat protein